jgi:CRISPR-associated endonuclease/helicase Cas3
MKKYYAHTKEGKGPEEWQPLEEHLTNVAKLAGQFAAEFGAEEWGRLAGLWHDLGKYSDAFQQRISSDDSPRVDHSTAGSQYSVEKMPVIGLVLAYAIAGHHGGMPDVFAEGACLDRRLKKELEEWRHGLAELPDSSLPKQLPLPLDAFAAAFFARMIFSCLVDGDFLDTEAFVTGCARRLSEFPSLGTLYDQFFQTLEKYDQTIPVNHIRAGVREQCEMKAFQPKGFFSLTVPTGGGKTLSSLAFALKHARQHGMRRIIYVVPFTTIIEQTARVFREKLGANAVLEHHCNVDPNQENETSRLAAENWEAPLVLTTSVQFYESLFANRPAACRKLHNVANSIIILDEAQTLPVDYLKPCLAALRELVSHYGCTVVLCTATQPAILKRKDFAIGLEDVREIIDAPVSLYEQLKRVEVVQCGKMVDDQLADALQKERQALCVVNTTGHARKLFERIKEHNGIFHLSGRMCPAHRMAALDEIRNRLQNNCACVVISTQLVEAGVDLDFPVVYRAMAGLDSLAQAAGRCNRNGRLKRGRVNVFASEHERAERYFRETAQCAGQVIADREDLFELVAVEQYFRLYYWSRQARWDAKHIMDRFRLAADPVLPLQFGFATATRDFRLIDDGAQYSVIIPWNEGGHALCEELRKDLRRELLRKAQRYVVQIREREWQKHVARSITMLHDRLGILDGLATHYDSNTGLNLEADGPGVYME